MWKIKCSEKPQRISVVVLDSIFTSSMWCYG